MLILAVSTLSFFLYCRIASTILTLEIALEQFLIVQESEYLQGLLSAELFHCFYLLHAQHICDEMRLGQRSVESGVLQSP